ncbi:YdgH/BhsA/McbA-like domain containing protein [Klebsiella aerogenes]|uniref:YdgH/BhsA/McbA-like domain containing protein n=1 Tax=Klebsiella aerogenes TaxID=548 RepID=UPI002E37D36C|nr:YdgH/BhsA/McbA-like domain containing protein [Klebsiella aerogenes]MED7793192.1 YdgH/BhsA/McbA-like domain containing protein [Klebsiella aerogenes]
MKNIIKTTVAVIALSVSALSYAASPQMVTRSDAASLQKIGVVSSGGFTSLDELDASLVMKAADAGASHYRIVNASGNNKLSGVAVLYR